MTRLLVVGALVLGVASGAEAQAKKRDVVKKPAAQTDAATILGYQAPRADGSRSCACNELQRRLSGLEALGGATAQTTFKARFPQEARSLMDSQGALSSQVRSGRDLYNDAGGKSYVDQERLCGEGLVKLDAVWRQWQPFLSRQSMDSDYFRGVKASHPGIPDEGDLEADRRGRTCDRGQWWDDDRARWALNGREGICSQERYEVKQVLRGSPGERGHRCFEYALK